jgi:carboxyl-terminal processing protease
MGLPVPQPNNEVRKDVRAATETRYPSRIFNSLSRVESYMISWPAARPVSRLLSVTLLSAAIACGNDEPTGPASPATIAPAAAAYLDTSLAFMEEYYYYRDTVSWTTKRTRAYRRAGGAQTSEGVYAAIDTAVQELGDNHSFFYRPQESVGATDHPPTPFFTPASYSVAPRVAYVWVPLFGGKSLVGRADTIQRAVARADSTPGLCGWILDLRGNPGGFWPVMLAGLSPLITPGRVGGFVERDTTQRFFYYVEPGVASLQFPNGQVAEGVRLPTTYQVRNPSLPIAILQGDITASAGEIVLMAFKEPGRVRTFGAPSFGATTQPYTYEFSDGASLQITAAMMFDRQGHIYGGQPIPVDQAVSGPQVRANFVPGSSDPVITAAVNWLNTQAQCAAAGEGALRPAVPSGGTWRATRPIPGAIPANQWPRQRPIPWIAR